MTSGAFHSIPISSIVVLRESRQRRDISDVGELVDSIRRLGLINPITITRDNVLVAGERRLEACKKIGWTNIQVQYTDEISDHDLRSIELEENVKRKELPWQDECIAVMEYHNHRKAEDPEWGQSDTARAIGYKDQYVSHRLKIAQEIIAGNEKITEAPRYSIARGIVERKTARLDEQAMNQFKAAANITPVPQQEDAIIVADFHQWAESYSGPRFNFIHCDFPYGIGADTFAQGSAALHGGYTDEEETYWDLCNSLVRSLDRICSESCHFIFWFSLNHYAATMDFFHSHSDIVVDPFPLVWLKSDGAGILPDPTRGPRRIYETAFFAHRGDRKIVRSKSNGYAAPTVRDTHMSIKPEPMLRYFFEMFVDESTRFLDPTCGSGSSVRAAESLKASYVLGLERNPEWAEQANVAQRRMRSFMKLESHA